MNKGMEEIYNIKQVCAVVLHSVGWYLLLLVYCGLQACKFPSAFLIPLPHGLLLLVSLLLPH